MLRDAHFMSIADRSILSCWGVKGGKAGRPFQVTVDPGGPNEHEVDALADAEPVRAGEVIRIRTTGGGGWGDPLDRPVDEVLRDIALGQGVRRRAPAPTTASSPPAAGRTGRSTSRPPTRCGPSCGARATGEEPFFDRGPGYARLSEGRVTAEVDWL